MMNNKFGQILATILLGLEDALAVRSQPSILLNPTVLSDVISGFTSIWITAAPASVTGTTPAAPAPAPEPSWATPSPAPSWSDGTSSTPSSGGEDGV